MKWSIVGLAVVMLFTEGLRAEVPRFGYDTRADFAAFDLTTAKPTASSPTSWKPFRPT